jgi:hypothetical protein
MWLRRPILASRRRVGGEGGGEGQARVTADQIRGLEGEVLTGWGSRWQGSQRQGGRLQRLRHQVIGSEAVAEVGCEVARDLLEVEAQPEKDGAQHSAVSSCGGR